MVCCKLCVGISIILMLVALQHFCFLLRKFFAFLAILVKDIVGAPSWIQSEGHCGCIALRKCSDMRQSQLIKLLLLLKLILKDACVAAFGVGI